MEKRRNTVRHPGGGLHIRPIGHALTLAKKASCGLGLVRALCLASDQDTPLKKSFSHVLRDFFQPRTFAKLKY